MPRTARPYSESSIYHVINRGVGKQIIFENDGDRAFFMQRLKSYLEEEGGSLLAWCLMDNHFHLLVSAEHEAVSSLMHRLSTSYVGYFNRVHDRSGTLFGSRFRSEPVQSDEYLMTVVRYIHENPVKAHMAGGLNYRWSSYSEYVLGETYIDSSLVLGLFGGVEQFVAFHHVGHGEDGCIDFVDAGSKPTRLSDEEALRLANEVLGQDSVLNLGTLDRNDRDAALAALKRSGIGVRQIQRLTGVSLGVISRA